MTWASCPRVPPASAESASLRVHGAPVEEGLTQFNFRTVHPGSGTHRFKIRGGREARTVVRPAASSGATTIANRRRIQLGTGHLAHDSSVDRDDLVIIVRYLP